MDDKFQRMKLIIGENGFKVLKESTIAIFGVGGVGSFVVEGLARCGVGKMVLIDKDNIDCTNINRQIHAMSSTIGKSKVEVMRERILDINPDLEVETVQKFLLPTEKAEEFFICGYDYVIDAIDNISAKIFLIEECKKRGIRIISSMGAGNKVDATGFRVGDIFETKMDPVAKILRKKLREKGIEGLKVVYSEEKPRRVGEIIGSVAFVPSVAGLIIAGEVIKDLIGLK